MADEIINEGKIEFFNKLEQEFDKYKYAMKGINTDALIDFIENMEINAKKEHWKLQTTIGNKIPIIDFDKILQHLEDMTFDPVTGNFI